jgi:conserved oligomeric Golgi complex subunit 6
MAGSSLLDQTGGMSPTVLSPNSSSGTVPTRSTALSNKLTSVLSASYADLEIRDALEALDDRSVKNTAESRRRLRLDVQREVIQCNSEIIGEFGQIAEVCYLASRFAFISLVRSLLTLHIAIEAYWLQYSVSEQML